MTTRISFCLLLLAILQLPNSFLFKSAAQARIDSDGTLRRLNVPILMYHYVGALPPNADAYRRDLTVSTMQFRQHLAMLSANQYNAVSLYELEQALHFGTPLPPNPVILTFDDGYDDHYLNVLPALQEFGFTATFFVITDFIDQNRPGYLTWAQVQALADAGMSIESHTKNHPDLRGQDSDFLTFQIIGSIETLAHYTKQTPRMFSYPAGRYDANTLAWLRTTDIALAVTTQPGTLHTSDATLELARLRVSSTTTAQELLQRLQN